VTNGIRTYTERIVLEKNLIPVRKSPMSPLGSVRQKYPALCPVREVLMTSRVSPAAHILSWAID
jgi:hypothetical protein